jgi:acetaldehyde dehydrogenase
MRDTVHCLIGDVAPGAVESSVVAMVDAVAAYVPGYRLKQRVQFRGLESSDPAHDLVNTAHDRPRWQVSVYLEVEGAALPARLRRKSRHHDLGRAAGR